jgi:hypothetical protein
MKGETMKLLEETIQLQRKKVLEREYRNALDWVLWMISRPENLDKAYEALSGQSTLGEKS